MKSEVSEKDKATRAANIIAMASWDIARASSSANAAMAAMELWDFEQNKS